MSEENNLIEGKEWLRGLPNQITLFRVAIVPIIIVLLPLNVQALDLFAAFLFGLAGISDGLDGYIARKYNLVTKLGAILDPIADKLLTTAALVLLVHRHNVWAWMAALFLCRDVAISGIRHMASQQNIEIHVSGIGKWKTFLLDIGLTCMIVNYSLFGWPWVEVGMISLWVSLVLSLYSGWEYMSIFWKKANI